MSSYYSFDEDLAFFVQGLSLAPNMFNIEEKNSYVEARRRLSKAVKDGFDITQLRPNGKTPLRIISECYFRDEYALHIEAVLLIEDILSTGCNPLMEDKPLLHANKEAADVMVFFLLNQAELGNILKDEEDNSVFHILALSNIELINDIFTQNQFKGFESISNYLLDQPNNRQENPFHVLWKSVDQSLEQSNHLQKKERLDVFNKASDAFEVCYAIEQNNGVKINWKALSDDKISAAQYCARVINQMPKEEWEELVEYCCAWHDNFLEWIKSFEVLAQSQMLQKQTLPVSLTRRQARI